MADELIFYTNPMSRGQIVRWMLEEVGAPYEPRILDYGTTMKDAAYLAINPMGKVPAIVHDGKVVTECAAICAYLADAFPDAGLAPARRRPRRLLPLAVFHLGTGRTGDHRQAFRASSPMPSSSGSAGFGSLPAALDALETAVAGKAFVAGDRFSAADVYVGSQIDWGLQFGTIASRPAFEAYVAPLRERAAYKRAKDIDNALIAEMQAANPS